MLNNKLLYYRISYQRYAIVIHIHCTYNSCNIYRHEWCACYTCLKSKGWGYGIHIRQITSAYVTNNQGCVMQVLKCLIPMLCVSNTVHISYNLNVTRMVYAETTRVAHACFVKNTQWHMPPITFAYKATRVFTTSLHVKLNLHAHTCAGCDSYT